VNQIWSHLAYRLQDYNLLVLKKDDTIFLATHLEVKIDFLTYEELQNQHEKTLVRENIIQLTHFVYKMALKCQK